MSNDEIVAETTEQHNVPDVDLGALADVDAQILAARSRSASVEELEALQAQRNEVTGEGGEVVEDDGE